MWPTANGVFAVKVGTIIEDSMMSTNLKGVSSMKLHRD